MKTEEKVQTDVRRFSGVVTNAGEGSRRVTFRASTSAKDRHRSRVMPAGIDTLNFDKNPIFLWGHDGYGGWETPKMENVLGRVVSHTKTEQFFDVEVEFVDASVNPKAEMALGLTRAGALNTVSIGFIPREIVIETDEANGEIPVIMRSELLEVSLVPIPSNPEAVALVRSMVHAMDGDRPSIEAMIKTAVDAVRKELSEKIEVKIDVPVKVVEATAPGNPPAEPAVVMGEAVRQAFLNVLAGESLRRALTINPSQL